MRTLYFSPVSSCFFFSLPDLSGCRWDVYHTSTHGLALVQIKKECRSEMCCMWLAGNAGPKKNSKNSPSGHHRTTLSGCIFATKACMDNWKNLLRSNISPTCPHNMVNFCQLTAEIRSGVWGTPANFSGFRVLASLLHGTLVADISHTCGVEQRRHLYSAGWLSHWALALILVDSSFFTLKVEQVFFGIPHFFFYK